MNRDSLPETASDRPVLVIGAAGMDMIGTIQENPRTEGSNPASIRVSYGGVARNVAENLAHLGQPVRLISAVGSDAMGQNLLAHTAACGVDVSACLQLNNSATASYLAVIQSEVGPVMALDDMRVLGAVTPAYLRQNAALFADAAMVFIDANLQPAVLKTVFSMARRAGVPVCADTTSTQLATRLVPHLEEIYLLTANGYEASVINPDTPEITGRFTALQAVRQLVNRGAEIAVIPLAHFGVCYATSETSGHVPAVRTRVVDPTGAGDALTATVIFGLVNGISIDESLRLGVTAASLILKYPGTVFPGLTLEKLYDELVI
jgi:pseudouridine kinase